jgi:SAM-dependent methyltransferase
MSNNLRFFLNPANWIRAYFYNRKNAKFDKSSYDLELYLYSKILKNDMLHYGYFDVNIEPDTISLRQVEDAQVRYAQEIIDLLNEKTGVVLDVGCGMGGLSSMLTAQAYKVEALTPNANQAQHIAQKYPHIICHHLKFENFTTDAKYNFIIHAESLQYINLEKAFEQVSKLLLPGGRWIVVDYFRTIENASNKSGHLVNDFYMMADKCGWRIVVERDITLNVLPTIKVVNMYADRFLVPLRHFAFEKLRYKKGWLYYLTQHLRASATQKMEKEMLSVDPEHFIKEKKYMLFVLENVTDRI